MQHPSLTVLMPVYNAAPFLPEAIESVLAQTFQNFELLIIDDGSTDGSLDIVRSYPDERIRLVCNPGNMGISASLNRGIELAAGELIARMDADDVCAPNRLLVQWEYMRDHPEVAMVACWARVVDEAKNFVREDEFRPEYYYYNINFICWIYHPTVVYRKEVVVGVGGYLERYSEDFDLFWRLYRTSKVHVIPEFLLLYRITGQSLHQVLKREEYERAQQEQVVRNLRFYMGDHFELSATEVEYLRHQFEPRRAMAGLWTIVHLFRKLKAVNKRILSTDNVNRVIPDIKEAAHYKLVYMRHHLTKDWPVYHKVLLHVFLFSWGDLFSSGKKVVSKKLRKKVLR